MHGSADRYVHEEGTSVEGSMTTAATEAQAVQQTSLPGNMQLDSRWAQGNYRVNGTKCSPALPRGFFVRIFVDISPTRNITMALEAKRADRNPPAVGYPRSIATLNTGAAGVDASERDATPQLQCGLFH